jgi:hypothetical protein
VTTGEAGNTDLAAGISAVVDRLAPNSRFLVDFVDSGGKSGLFVGWFLKTGNSGDILDWRLLARLAELRLNLELDVYANWSNLLSK